VLFGLLAIPATAHPHPQLAPATQHCTRAAADQAILAAHREAEPGDRHPALHLLCGAFTGPGVEAMAASVRIPSCGLTGDWLVWRYTGGRWRQVFESGNGVVGLVAVGNDIKETQNVLRPTDAHCFPTGGTRSQVWHWNGSRFVGGGWKYSKQEPKPKPKPQHDVVFYTPSRNLSCEMADGAAGLLPHVFCQSIKSPHAVTMKASGSLKICRGPQCPVNYGEGTKLQLLGYGRSLTVGRFSCRSETTGVFCMVTALARGFTIDRDGVLPFQQH
jgi:hypothetical protein